jgi:hypothetical protein
MLHGLSRLLTRIAADGLAAEAVYRRDDLHRRRAVPVPPGGRLCPVCGATARRFLPFGLDGRREALCPACGSLERHRFLWWCLETRLGLGERRWAILHTAPEPCVEARLRSRRAGEYVSVDRYDPSADVRADLTDLPFADARFDLIVSSHVLEHVEDDRRALRELARVLKRSGRLVLMFPYDPAGPTREDPAVDTPAKRLAAYGHPYHYRVYGTDVPERLAEAGLAAEEVAAERVLPGFRRRRLRLRRNRLFVCSKR